MSNGEVVSLHSRWCTKTLRDYLTRAEAGEFVTVAVVAIDRSGTVHREYSNDSGRLSALLGGIELLKSFVIRTLEE